MLQLTFLNDNLSSPFDAIKRVDEYGNEFWYARELMALLEYTKWTNFKAVVIKASIALENVGYKLSDHIAETSNMIETGKGAKRKVDDFKLSRLACYHTAQEADVSKPIVAAAKNYFVIQVRKQELSSDQKQLKYDQSVTAYQLMGKSEADAKSRVGAKQAVKEQNAAAYRAHKTNSPNYGEIGSAQNKALFDMTKKELVEYLGLLPKDADKYRDRLGRWANEAVRLSAKEIARQMSKCDSLSDSEIVAIVTRISRQVAEHARALAELDRVDFLSGAPLDDDGNPQLPRNIRLLPKG